MLAQGGFGEAAGSWSDDDGDGTTDAPAGFVAEVANAWFVRIVVLLLAIVMGLDWATYFYSKVTLISVKMTLLAAYPICYAFLVVLSPVVLLLTNFVLPWQAGIALATGTTREDATTVDSTATEMAKEWAKAARSFSVGSFVGFFNGDLEAQYGGLGISTYCTTPSPSLEISPLPYNQPLHNAAPRPRTPHLPTPIQQIRPKLWSSYQV